MRRQLAYLGVAAILLAVGVWLVVDRDGETPVAHVSVEGVYRIADARVGPPDAMTERPELAGRAFIIRGDGAQILAGLCPDEVTCRRWLHETPPAFRHSLPSLPVDIELAKAEPEMLLSAAHVVGTSLATTITTEDGRCRWRVDGSAFEPTEIGARLRRDLAQTELVTDCETHEATDRVAVDLSLVRLDLQP